jgi:hypothetical protein
MVGVCAALLLAAFIAVAWQLCYAGRRCSQATPAAWCYERWKPCTATCLALLLILGATAWYVT